MREECEVTGSGNKLARDYDAAKGALADAMADFRNFRERLESALEKVERIEPQGSTDWVESGRAMRNTIVREIRAAADLA